MSRLLVLRKITSIALIAMLALGSNVFAGHDDEGHHEKFSPGKLIIEHITDAHDWHLYGHASLPLPIIIYTSSKGIETFSSSNFHHGTATYNGYRLEHKHIIAVDANDVKDEAATSEIIDLSITKNVASLLLSIVILLLVFTSIAKSYKKNAGHAPSGLQSFLEPVILFVRDDIAKASIGEKHYMKFMPILLTIFFFIWINNILGLIPFFPGGANVTGNIVVPIVLATVILFYILKNSGKGYWRHVLAMPGVPTWVLFILTPIEILGILIKPAVLIIRLFANITAGHIVLLVFFCLIFLFGDGNTGAGYGTAVPAIPFTIFINCLELLVGILQAYVFTFLSAIYFGMAVVEDHH
ncbi:MAG: F0F1 ATP synthase subunit A [Flavobacteriales bacterium]|nr:F0F1 ATP synthase subunit A [Flavobacteriales bacterium]